MRRRTPARPGTALALAGAAAIGAAAAGVGVRGAAARQDGDGARAPSVALAPGDHEFPLEHGGLERFYRVHVPPAGTDSLPVVLAFHGDGGSADAAPDTFGLDPLADREGFLAVYPAGSGRLARRFLTWNAGDIAVHAHEQGVDIEGRGVSPAPPDEAIAGPNAAPGVGEGPAAPPATVP